MPEHQTLAQRVAVRYLQASLRFKKINFVWVLQNHPESIEVHPKFDKEDAVVVWHDNEIVGQYNTVREGKGVVAKYLATARWAPSTFYTNNLHKRLYPHWNPRK